MPKHPYSSNPHALAAFGHHVKEIDRRLDLEATLGKAADAAKMQAEMAEARATLHKHETTLFLEQITEEAKALRPLEFEAYLKSCNPFTAMMSQLGGGEPEDEPALGEGQSSRRLN